MKTHEHRIGGSEEGVQEAPRKSRDFSNRNSSGDARLPSPDPERHWQELHQTGNGSAMRLFDRVKSRMNGTSLAAVAGATATGFAIGALAISQRRQGVGERLLASLAPMGRRMAKLKNQW